MWPKNCYKRRKPLRFGLVLFSGIHSCRITLAPQKKTHYETLGISPTANSKEIKSAFLNLTHKYHPDKNMLDKNLHQRFIEINEAYGILSKHSSRHEYNLYLAQQIHGQGYSHLHPHHSFFWTYDKRSRKGSKEATDQWYNSKVYYSQLKDGSNNEDQSVTYKEGVWFHLSILMIIVGMSSFWLTMNFIKLAKRFKLDAANSDVDKNG